MSKNKKVSERKVWNMEIKKKTYAIRDEIRGEINIFDEVEIQYLLLRILRNNPCSNEIY